MALQAKIIKSKIRAISNVRKITKAMEKVAAVKMRRAVAKTLSAREYAFRTYELLTSLLGHNHLKHPFFTVKNEGKTLIVAMSSNRGLCGNLNTQLVKIATEYRKEHPTEECEVLAIGKKMEKLSSKLGVPLVASFINIPDYVSVRDILPVVSLIRTEFEKGTYRKVVAVYNHFTSPLVFTPLARVLLPMNKANLENVMRRLFKDKMTDEKPKFIEYVFEPGEEEVLDFLLPKILEIKTFKFMLESKACEQSARMMAMKNASENAESLIDDLAVSYNRARQDGITRELSEIAAGASA